MKIEKIAKTKQEVVFEAEQQKEVKEGRFNLRHGKITDNCDLIKSELKIDQIAGTGIIKGEGIQYQITDIEAVTKAKSGLWIHCQKLLMRIIEGITNRNQTQLSINIKEFAEKCGVDILKDSAVNQFQKNMMQALKVILNMKITIIQKVKNKKEEKLTLDQKLIIGHLEATKGYLSFIVADEFKTYINSHYTLKLIPVNIYKISGKSSNAYCVGMKLSTYNGNNNNKISLQNILKETSLPKLSDVRKNKNLRWTNKIRDPFNAVLDELTNVKLLKNYTFVTQNGDKRTREEANAMTAEQWHSLYFVYELA